MEFYVNKAILFRRIRSFFCVHVWEKDELASTVEKKEVFECVKCYESRR